MKVFSLTETRELLVGLGLASAQGQLPAECLRKLRQIEGMLPWLLAAVRGALERPATLVELGCGKAYLAFFLAAAMRKLGLGPFRIIGSDRDPALVDRCRRVRETLGWDEISFTVATCEEFTLHEAPLLVTSLHACDTATDHVLAAGIALEAQHIIAAPCCHFTAQRRLRETGHRHDWGYLARSFPVLGSQFSESLTDGMRCLCLRAHGYDVQVREFVSGIATPQNLLIIARQAGQRGSRALRELRRLQESLGLDCEVQRSLNRRRVALRGCEARAHERIREQPTQKG